MRAVYTDLWTLTQIKDLLNDAGLKDLIDDPKGFNFSLQSLFSLLSGKSILVDFLQIITNDKDTDWSRVPLKEVIQCLENFTLAIWDALPKQMQDLVKEMYQQALTSQKISFLNTSSHSKSTISTSTKSS